MPPAPTPRAALTRSFVLALLAAGSARADLSQASAPTPGGFLQTGAFAVGCGCFVTAGSDLRQIFGNGPDLHEQAFTGGGSAANASVLDAGSTHLSASGTAGLGFMRGVASRVCPDTNEFSTGIANGGWNDTLTVTHPAHAGQEGFLVFQVRAKGSLHAEGGTGSGYFQVAVYKDNLQPSINPHFDRGDSNDLGTSLQMVQWGLATYSLNETADLAVDDVATFSIPFTFGQPFKLGVHAAAFAGQRSSGGLGFPSTGRADFSRDGAAWNGITAVYAGGVLVSGAALASSSGVDWSGPSRPCPADFNGDGFLDFFDYDDFVGCFESGSCPPGTTADYNGDGFADFFDYDDFVAGFEAGC